ncbi:MAG: DUF4394 domain-containing protein [Vicinamibacterales bacterium]
MSAASLSFGRVVVMVAVSLFTGASQAWAQSTATVYAVTSSNRIITVSSANPSIVLRNVPITNLAPGENVLGIDVRPANNLLYGLGSSSQLYLINPASGAAIRIGGPLTPALQGTVFGFDFNPTVDRIRIVSNTGQNLRVHPETTAVTVDGNLAYATTDVNAAAPPRVVAAGYTNPDNNPATGTMLFDIDSTLNIGVVQNPPNNGTLNTFVGLGVDVTDFVSLDFNLTDAFIAAQVVGSSTSTLIQFSGGVSRTVGTIGGGELVSALAVSLGDAPTPPAGLVYVLTTNNELAAFNADMPSVILGRGPIANLPAGERIVGIDFRPANNLLYGLGSSGQLYLLDTATAAASRVGLPLSTPLVGTEFGFDFNPVVDRIRVVSDARQNLRLHPETGALAATDGMLAYRTSDPNFGQTPRVVAAGYTNPDNDPATSTTLFVVDSGRDIGAIQDPPNDGALNTFASLGIDASDLVGLDFSRSRILLSVVPAGASATFLYDVTGTFRFLGAIGTPAPVRDIAISLGR